MFQLYISPLKIKFKLLQKLKTGFKRTINWKKYQSKEKIKAPDLYLDYLIDLIFQ